MFRHEVTARNPATDSENRIHADDVARKYGFAGGLVPGVTVYAYACAPIVEALGDRWIESGSARLRLVAPAYDGESVIVTLEDDLSLEVSAGGRVCATGAASLDVRGVNGQPVDRAPVGHAARPSERPPASEEVFTPGRVLGSIRLPTDAETMEQYIASIDEPDPVYLERRLVHPGMFLNGANWILGANVVMPAWIHGESEIQHFRAVGVGEPVDVRARVSESFEKRHRFAVIDVDWVSGEDLVASGRHTFIWQLAES